MAHIGIIGAGLCGLTAAERLRQAGHRTSVVDKGRGIGGRLASRQAEGAVIDHGSPWAQGDDPQFVTWLENHGAQRYAAIRGQGWVGTPKMNSFLKPLGQDTATGVEIAELARENDAWVAVAADGGRHGPFDALVLAIPAPQAAELLTSVAPDMAEALGAVQMAPVWTLLVAFDDRLKPPADRTRSPEIDYLARMADRPGRAKTPDAWAMHMTEAYSRENLEMDRDAITPRLLDAFAGALGLPLPTPRYLAAHRWRYARTATPLGRSMLSGQGLYVGGDWALGPLAEAAWRSGRDMGDAAAEALSDGAAAG